MRALNRELDVQTLPQLLRAAKDGRVREVPGFGRRPRHILESIQAHISQGHCCKLVRVAQYAERLLKYLAVIAGVERTVAAGSFRRMRETLGD